jgi:DNA-directed RNA polymerase specialized sigma24 family protein
LTLFYLQGLPQREAASVMELTDSAFESLLHRARTALAHSLEYLRSRGTT